MLATKLWPASFGVCTLPPSQRLHHRFAKLVVNSTNDEKIYPEMAGLYAPKELRRHLKISLCELGTQCVGILCLHALDLSVLFKDAIREVNVLYKEGKFKKP